MASLIPCPHCGMRPKEEFSIRGDASPKRPAPSAPVEAFQAYVFLRDNPKGRTREYWHHAFGCRRWLVVERDTMSHEVYAVRDAAQLSSPEAAE
nr:sarcosine oxidase subunit delta [uncultured Gellertiella sp.]